MGRPSHGLLGPSGYPLASLGPHSVRSGWLKNLGRGVDSRARPRETTIVVVPLSR